MKHLLKRVLPESVVTVIRKIRDFRKYRLVKGPFNYREDRLLTKHNTSALETAEFVRAYELGRSTESWIQEKRWRARVVCWAAHHGARLNGDFVECGVNKGGYARMVIEYINFSQLSKTFFLLDTFSGLDGSLLTAGERARGISEDWNDYEECFEKVQETFGSYDNVKLIRGSVPNTLPQVKTKSVAFLSIDMNNVTPEIAAGEYFWEKLVSGAVVVLDDYGWTGHEEQRKSWDEFAQDRGHEVLALPTGQGLLVKS